MLRWWLGCLCASGGRSSRWSRLHKSRLRHYCDRKTTTADLGQMVTKTLFYFIWMLLMVRNAIANQYLSCLLKYDFDKTPSCIKYVILKCLNTHWDFKLMLCSTYFWMFKIQVGMPSYRFYATLIFYYACKKIIFISSFLLKLMKTQLLTLHAQQLYFYNHSDVFLQIPGFKTFFVSAGPIKPHSGANIRGQGRGFPRTPRPSIPRDTSEHFWALHCLRLHYGIPPRPDRCLPRPLKASAGRHCPPV